ncbi:MAG: TolC family protein [Cytophagales bacterium]|nr:TolC family protein [Cytophagales bacterium]
MKKYVNILMLTLIANVHMAEAQTLDDYLMEAAENNPGLKAGYLEFEAALQKSAQVQAIPDLALSFGYFVSPVETRVGPQRAKFSLVQMFPWFGTNGTKVDASEFNAQAKYHEFLDRKNELYYRVKKAYHPILELKEHIRWQKENLEILNTYKRLSTTNFSNGKGAMADVIRVDIMIDNATTEIQLLQDRLRPLQVAFNRLLNRPDSNRVVVQKSSVVRPVDNHFSIDSVIANNPRLQAIEFNIQAASAMEETAGKQGLPTFGVGFDYVVVDKRTDPADVPDNGKNVFMPMVTMSLPLFRKKYNASIKEAQWTHSALNQKKSDVTNSLVSACENELYKIRKNLKLLELYDVQIQKTKQAIDLLYSAYSNSGNDFEEVLRMEQQLLKYNMSRATAVKDFSIAEARLDYLTAKSN